MSVNWNHNKEHWEEHKEYLRERARNNKEMYKLAQELYYNGDAIRAKIKENQIRKRDYETSLKWYFGYISNQ